MDHAPQRERTRGQCGGADREPSIRPLAGGTRRILRVSPAPRPASDNLFSNSRH